MKKLFISILVISILIISSCTSVQKDTGEIKDSRNRAEKEFDLGSMEASRGNFNSALTILTESKKNAILSDNSSIIARICLVRAEVLFSLGRIDEAFKEWDFALLNAQFSNDRELISVAKVFRAKGNLLSEKESAQSVLDEVNREGANIKSNSLYVAFYWQTRGLAYRALGSWREAEDSFKKSLDIHEKNRYFENASYDWYTIASIRSISGNSSGALQALEQAIALDRQVENSWGLAASWRAMGDVLVKAGRSQEAVNAYSRAREIYIAMGNESEAKETDKRMMNLK